MINLRPKHFTILFAVFLSISLSAQGHNHDHDHDHDHDHQHQETGHEGHNHSDHQGHNHSDHDGHNHNDHQGHNHSDHEGHGHDEHHANACGMSAHHGEFNPGDLAFHHVSDQNVYNIGPLQIPLPCIMWVPKQGFDFFSSGKFNADSHGNGTKVYKKYVLHHGLIQRVPNFPTDELVDIGHHDVVGVKELVNEKEKTVSYLCYKGQTYKCEDRSTLDGGLFGGGLTSFHDLSITKNVTSMGIVVFLLSWLFLRIARAYKRREGMAPAGMQGFIEPIFVFIQDEVAKPFLGKKWKKFLPLLLALFFFILGLNLWGQVPFLGGSNVTGSLSVTFVLAIVAFLVTNFNGNKDYWKHILWMPGVPAWVKTILTPVELLGVFIKPLTLMLRLFANITAGHMVLVIFVSLIFVFSKNGLSTIGGYGTVIPAALLSVFMMAIELLVAFIQAFVFTILTASYIGAATEEHHH